MRLGPLKYLHKTEPALRKPKYATWNVCSIGKPSYGQRQPREKTSLGSERKKKMSGLETRVTNLEEQVGGIRETVAVIQTEQKYTVGALGRIEERLDEMRERSLWSLVGALKHPQTLIMILTVLGGLMGNNAMLAMAESMAEANAAETVDIPGQ
jgi:hypothetical protein